jgi:cobalt-zinc-cadmium efflux system membrane fusion protein
MTITSDHRRWQRHGGATALACLLVLTACSSKERESADQMTSFSAKAAASATPRLFIIPEDQMSHVQVVTVQPATLTRTLRLTGAVAYNAFKTTPGDHPGRWPGYTHSGGSRAACYCEGQPMLEVSSPDYSQLLDAYLKAADSSRLAEQNYARAQDLYQHHAIAERDLEQAESDRNQAEADLNAAEKE